MSKKALDKVIKTIEKIEDKDTLIRLYLILTGKSSYSYKKTIKNPCLDK